jgi:transposase
MRSIDARSLSATAQEALRRRVVRAVQTGGVTQSDAARVFGVTRRAVSKWMAAYRAGGRARGRPPGGGTRVTPAQAARVVRCLTDRMPDQLKLPFYLWTREAVRRLIRQQTGTPVSLSTTGRYLRAWGFSPQKPVRRAFERNPVAVRRWLRTEYPALRTRAHREGAEIHWGDEMGVRSDHTAGRSYARRGQTPVVAGTGQRFGCNMVSTITNRGALAFLTFAGRFTQPVFLRFLRRLVRHSATKVFIIVDGHPVHRGRQVREWVTAHAEEIALVFLPGYSPELNPDELLNQDVKTHTGKQRPHHQGELLKIVRGHLRRRQRQPHIVRAFFEHKDTRYAA